jgi:transcription antitermination factor NusG
MPFLKQERFIFPDDLLDAPPPADSERRWWAAYTKARQEKAFARELAKFAVPFYLPLVERSTLVRGRRVQVWTPLFSGYVFLFVGEDERLRALKTNRLSQLIPVSDQERLRRDLAQVQKLIATQAEVTLEPRIVPGQRVRVKTGAFMGIEGLVESRRGGYRLIVEVSFLQQGVSVELDELSVERLD